ncbi:hypothetical protein AFCDBAGC_0684 [Methylobacterium cerastii]|uniref:Uncharacterized protein n=1 Tax=Methylobacterium cerastii TaxID=932741 RepID=A0ABQ4QCK6_9HYPH|nr:hypothetical protein [Methylobacterium cerastii]GJD42842.1 hypothetical protein AFCDBAGC_0684 [Methylobacterium cerastii]
MNPIEVLTNARSREVPWPLIVEALHDISKNGSIDEHGRPWIEVAAHLTGYSTNHLRIGQRTFALIKNIIQENQLPGHALEWPISNLEVLTRISKINSRRAQDILISKKRHTLRELRDLYDAVRNEAGSSISAMSAGHQSAKAFTRNMFSELSDVEILRDLLSLDQDVPLGQLKVWPGRYPYAHPDFHVGFLINDRLQLAAFEGLRFYGDVTSQVATKAALKAAVEATFFSQYYWCTPSWVSTLDLQTLRDELGLLNVGIVTISEKKVESVLRPLGPSVHDRQAILLKDKVILSRLGLHL